MDNKKLLQVKMTERARDEIILMQKSMGFSSNADVIKFSIAFFKWALDKQKDGYDIYAVPRDNQKGEKVQLMIPF